MGSLSTSNLSFNTTPLGAWSTADNERRYDRATIKLVRKTGLSLPVAQAIESQNGLGNRGT
jgi:hypothetical protein